jgi:YidC/Oxa1 family membrane protein insertase
MLPTYTGAAFYDEETKFNKIDFSDIEDENFLMKIQSGWISMIQHYFFTAWIPNNKTESTQTVYTRRLEADGQNGYLIGTVGNYKKVEPSKKQVFKSSLFAGPKKQDEIDNIAPGLVLTVDYGVLTFLAAPLFWVLAKIYYVFGNWGWSIIMLTILVKIIFFKLSETSYKSMAKMKKLAPRMQMLKERFGDDRKKFSEALMKVYKEEKVNPLGGCFPILIQIPVFISLYWVIIESVEMRHAPFIGWINDLSSADPFFVLPITMGITMYVQQKLNPPPTDEMQKKIFMALPFIFTFLFATFPSGLVLYWVTNNVLSIAQQYIINKRVAAL